MIDVLVIGAGPAGTTTARLCAQAGLRVHVLEEHAEVGRPVHCTGIVGGQFLRDFAIPPELVLRELRRFRVYAPSGSFFDLPDHGHPVAYVLDRHALDVHLCRLALDAGASLDVGTKALGVEPAADGVMVRASRDGECLHFEASLCVLACGAMSNLPARSGISPPRSFYRTVQANFGMPGIRGAEIYLGRRVAPGSFAYAVEVEEGVAKVGLITRGPAHQGYHRLLRETGLVGRVSSPLTSETYRRIPMGASRRSVNGRVCGVGDAVGQAKTTTGGGLYYAMLCARMLAESIVASRQGASGVDQRVLEGYDRAWRSRLGLQLQAGLWLRGFFEHVGDADVDRTVALASTPEIRQLLEREWDFDFHGPLLKALARSPELRFQALRTASNTLRGRRVLDLLLGVVERSSTRGLLRVGAGEAEPA